MSTEVICDPCQYRGIKSRATKYCTTCQERQCKECTEVHRSSKATRKHLLVDSQSGILSSKLGNHIEAFQHCDKHSDKSLEFYCGEHKEFICSMCLLTSKTHKNCVNIVDITTVGDEAIKNKFTVKVTDDLKAVISQSKHAAQKISDANTNTKSCIDTVRDQLSSVRAKLLAAFDKQAKGIEEVVLETFEASTSQSTNVVAKLERLHNAAEDCESLFRTLINAGSSADVFRGVVSVIGQIEEFHDQYLEATKSEPIFEIQIEKSELLNRLETNDKPLLSCHIKDRKVDIPNLAEIKATKGELQRHIVVYGGLIKTMNTEQLNEEPVVDRTTSKNETNVKRTPESIEKNTYQISGKVNSCSEKYKISSVPSHERAPVGDIRTSSNDAESEDAKTKLEMEANSKRKRSKNVEIVLKHGVSIDLPCCGGKTPCIGGIVCLPDDRLVLSDTSNKRLLIYTEDNEVIKKFDLKYEPGQMALLNERCIMVCLMKTNKMILMTFSKSGYASFKYIQMRYIPECVQMIDNNSVLVSMKDAEDRWHMDLVQNLESANPTRWAISLKSFHDGYQFATQKIPKDSENTRIIHCCQVTNIMQCLKLDGSLIYNCEVGTSSSVVTDSNGYIFLVRHGGEVEVLDSNGEYQLRFRSAKLQNAKHSAFSKNGEKLFITKRGSSKICVLHITRS